MQLSILISVFATTILSGAEIFETCTEDALSECVGSMMIAADMFLPVPDWAHGIATALHSVETFVASEDGQKAIGMVKDGWEKLVVPCVSNITRCTHNLFGQTYCAHALAVSHLA